VVVLCKLDLFQILTTVLMNNNSAFGHPLGCTGARQIVTALSELKRTGKKIAVTSMCVGTGMGMAGMIVSEQ
jgi:acetyl-CoA acetyltransferase